MEKSRATGEGRGLAAGALARLRLGCSRRPLLWAMLASLSSAALYCSSFPPFELPETAFVFALPLLLWAAFQPPLKGERWVLYLSGLAAWTFLLSWLRHSVEVLNIPLQGAAGWGLVVALAAIVALFWWAWAVVTVGWMRRARIAGVGSRILILLGIAGLWVGLEWLRSVIFSGFPWLPLSASQWQRPLLLQMAAWTGAWGISFVLIAFNCGLSIYFIRIWTLRREKWWKRFSPEFYTALVLLFGAIGLGLYGSGAARAERSQPLALGLVQPDVSIPQKWSLELIAENMDTLERLTTYAGFLGVDAVLWPEAPSARPLLGDASMSRWVSELSSASGLPLLAGSVVLEGVRGERDAAWYNVVLWIDPQHGIRLPYYAKRRLVPFGEYVPLARLFPFMRTFVPINGDLIPGDEPVLIDFMQNGIRHSSVGSLICYEDIFPTLARENALAGADWHFVATNNAWFGEGSGAYQHAAHSVLRAVETRRPVVRCGNAGWSGWIDEYGHIRHVMRDNSNSIYFQGAERIDISLSRYWRDRESFYVRHGDWWVLVSTLLAGLTAVAVNLPWASWRQRRAYR